MKCIDFLNVSGMDFAITDIVTIYQSPSWTTLGSLDDNDPGRLLNGFLLIDSGRCHYEWKNSSADLEHGSLIYLPKGSKKIITVTEHPFSFYRICFTLTDISDGKNIIFTKEPWLISTACGKSFFDISEGLLKSTLSKKYTFESLSQLSRMFNRITNLLTQDESKIIFPAVSYIEKHYTENIDINILTELCHISESHLFRLFKEEMSTTPIAYCNTLRIERAKMLLLDNECSIGEISFLLGFKSIYYFSRVFKQHTGLSPANYKAQL